MSHKNALVVDDTPANRDFLERLLTQAGFDVMGASNGAAALSLLEPLSQLAVAVVDMQLPDTNGIHITYKLRQRFPNTYIIVATMHDEASLMDSVFHKGGNVYLVKPHGFMDVYKRLTTVGVGQMRQDPPLIYDRHGMRRYQQAQRRDNLSRV